MIAEVKLDFTSLESLVIYFENLVTYMNERD